MDVVPVCIKNLVVKPLYMRIKISEETIRELEEAKKFYRGMENDLKRDDVTDYRHRHDNRKFDLDFIIREALQHFNE